MTDIFEHADQSSTNPSTDLVPIDALVPSVVFAAGGAQDVLAKLRAIVAENKPDISTEKGRKQVKSIVRKIQSTKVGLDTMGKELSDRLRAQMNPILDERRQIKEGCDEIAEKYREPLTLWEAQEAERIKAHEDALADISALAGPALPALSSDEIRDRIKQLDELTVAPYNWQEFIQRAIDAKKSARATLDEMLAETVARETAEAEAAQRAAEEEAARQAELARLQAEREAEIARQAAEEARIAAEQAAEEEAARVAEAARLERERIQREADEAAEAARVERARIEAQAAQDAANAEAERQRLADEKQRLIDDAAAKEAARKEEQRVDYIRRMIQHIVNCGNGFIDGATYPYGVLFHELEEKIVYDDATFAEFKDEAIAARDAALKKLRDSQERQAEATRRHEQEKAAAVQAERDQQAAELRRQEADRQRREADKENRAKVNRKARDYLISHCGLHTDQATNVIKALAAGQIPGVRIEY